ncbi:MAG: PDZ domain-containing protein [Bacteroidales bacterium]|nr:PDZ domain-containing protein [Bacteroidales bacterium]
MREEDIYKERRRRNYLPFYLSIAMAIGLVIGMFLMPKKPASVLFRTITDNKLDEVVDLLQRYYFEELDIEKINDEAVQSLLLSLDPHSSYISRKEAQRYDEMLVGQFDGIGIQFNILNDTVLVINVVPEGPSQKVGLMPGDKIITVDREIIAGTNIQNEEVIQKLRGKKGTKVTLGIMRNGLPKLLTYEIIRDNIPLESINVAYMLDKEIGYVLVDNFTITTADEFTQALMRLKDQGMKKLILDLRGNPGGFLGAAIDMCDEFLVDDKLIVYTEGRVVGKDEYKASGRGLFEEDNQKLVVLIDEWSASASEIVAGAVQDHDRGIVIGRRSFGKGLVQRQFYLSDSSEVMLTVARYFTPSGRCIQKPFENTSNEDYFIDILKRYENGELENADSIKFIDSLKYKTSKGRTVYGGGGIMPDVFIPLQKSDSVVYFNKLANQGILFTYAMEYVDKHRKALEVYTNVQDFEREFSVSDAMVQQMVERGAAQGIPADEMTHYAKQEIKKWTKAYIARNLFNTLGFYQIVNKDDEMIRKAKEAMKSIKN